MIAFYLLFFIPPAVDKLKNDITYGIEQITMQGIDLKKLGISPNAIDGNGGVDGDQKPIDPLSREGLIREYKRLSVQLRQLQLLERRTQEQVNGLVEEERSCAADVQRFGNVMALREEAAIKMDGLSTTVAELEKKKATTIGVVKEAKERNEELKAKLAGNERYRQIAHLEDRLTDVLASNAEAQQTVAQQRREYDYSELQTLVNRQLDEVTTMLMASTAMGN